MKAQDGKIYKNIITGEILGNELWLGCNDTAENYIEVDKPIEVEPIEPVTQPEITISDLALAIAELAEMMTEGG